MLYLYAGIEIVMKGSSIYSNNFFSDPVKKLTKFKNQLLVVNCICIEKKLFANNYLKHIYAYNKLQTFNKYIK